MTQQTGFLFHTRTHSAYSSQGPTNAIFFTTKQTIPVFI